MHTSYMVAKTCYWEIFCHQVEMSLTENSSLMYYLCVLIGKDTIKLLINRINIFHSAN